MNDNLIFCNRFGMLSINEGTKKKLISIFPMHYLKRNAKHTIHRATHTLSIPKWSLFVLSVLQKKNEYGFYGVSWISFSVEYFVDFNRKNMIVKWHTHTHYRIHWVRKVGWCKLCLFLKFKHAHCSREMENVNLSSADANECHHTLNLY